MILGAPEATLPTQDSTDSEGMIRLLIVDDHPIVRLGLAALLGTQADMKIVATAGSGYEALEILRSAAIDVVLVDLRMSGLSGIMTLQKIREAVPYVRTMILSSFEYDEEIYAAVQAGSQGYIHKEAAPEIIMNSIREVFLGKQAFPRRISERLTDRGMTAGVSEREREVLHFVAKGLTNKEVAALLKISQYTVRNHLNHISEKLDVSDRTEAIFVAIQTGLITLT